MSANLSEQAMAWSQLVQTALRSEHTVSLEQLLLVRDLDGQSVRRFDPPKDVAPRLGAVLVLLYPDGDDLRLPLTVRSELLSRHRGEVSLPGGSIDPNEDGPISAALRECHEELGVDPAQVEVWGALSSFYIQPSNFQITPIVGFCQSAPVLRPNSAEVSAVITVTLRELLDPGTVHVEQWHLRGVDVMVPFFAIAGHKVWGATAIVLSEFVARVRHMQPPNVLHE